MVVAASSNYAGRHVDLFIMQGAQTTGMRRITAGLGGDTGGKITAGAQKAAQSFLIMFLTEKGSRQHDKEFGTRFLTTIRMSNMNDSLMPIVFRDAAEDVLDQQERYRTNDQQDDEIISALDLLTFVVPNSSEMSLTVQITTRAGAARTVILPVSLAVK